MSITDLLPIPPASIRRAEERLCQQVLSRGDREENLTYGKPTSSDRKGYAVEMTIFVASITLGLSLPEPMRNLTSLAVILVTARFKISVSNLNRNENFGDETVTVVECNLYVKKPYEAHRESGHGQQDKKVSAGVNTCTDSTEPQTMPQKPVCTTQAASEIQIVSRVPAPLTGDAKETVSLLGLGLFVVENLPITNTGQPQNVCETFRGWPSCFKEPKR